MALNAIVARGSWADSKPLSVLFACSVTQGISRQKSLGDRLAGYCPVRVMMLLQEDILYPGKSVRWWQERLSSQVDLNLNSSSAN